MLHMQITEFKYDCFDPILPLLGEKSSKIESGIYYYHADHLGSSSVVTDKNGKFHEHLEYFPYGETWINDRANNENLPYRFTGKELDPETGLYFYGARYYDAKLSRWISADPILNSYLDGKPNGGVYNSINLDMYNYCANNPVRFIDPDGNYVASFQYTFKNGNMVKVSNSHADLVKMANKLYQGKRNDKGLTKGQQVRAKIYGPLISQFSRMYSRKRDSFCYANSMFLAAAYFNKVEASEEGYNNFMYYMFVNNYMDPMTGWVGPYWKWSSEMGLSITRYKGEEAQKKYVEIMNGGAGTAFMIYSKGHWVFGVVGEDGQFNYDTSGRGPLAGPQQRKNSDGEYAPIKVKDIQIIEIVKKTK